MKRKGFTLIELLAVIVVLAIIALIAVPLVIKIIKKADKNAFKDSIYGIMRSGDLYYSRKEMNGEVLKNIKFNFPNNIEGLDVSNIKLINGEMRITLDGDISFALTNGKYCARKKYDDNKVIIDENIDTCEIPWIIKSDNECVEDANSICENGTKVLVKVNELETYNFYVIKDTGSDLILIMDRNLGGVVFWISKEDYVLAGGTEAGYGTYGSSAKGPLTALKLLEERTSNWTNIESMTYTVSDDSGGNRYNKIERKNVRARMLTGAETKNLGCTTTANSCPSFLTENFSGLVQDEKWGYWLSTANSSSLIVVQSIIYGSKLSNEYIHSDRIGVRPVISVNKNSAF